MHSVVILLQKSITLCQLANFIILEIAGRQMHNFTTFNYIFIIPYIFICMLFVYLYNINTPLRISYAIMHKNSGND